MSLEGWIATILVWSLLVALISSEIYVRRAATLLRSHHPAIWRSIGSPHPVLATSLVSSFGFHRFLWRREYRLLGDAELDRAASRAIVLRALCFGLFIICIGVGLLVS